MHYGDGQKREQPMTKNISLKDFRVHYNQHSTFQHSTKYIVAQITESYPLPVTVFVMHALSCQKPSQHGEKAAQCFPNCQLGSHFCESSILSALPWFAIQASLCDPYPQSSRGDMICDLPEEFPLPNPLCAFWDFIPPPDNQSDDSIFLMHELQIMLQPGHQGMAMNNL